jgi:two-component system, chemotaxis family, response regulator PixG
MVSSGSNLWKNLETCTKNQFTGHLHITATSGETWSLHFFLGRAIGDSGGIHQVRRWRRQISRYCHHLEKDSENLFSANDLQSGNYRHVERLAKNQRITREQALAVIQGSMLEVLFDIIRLEELANLGQGNALKYTHHPVMSPATSNTPLVLLKLEYLWAEVAQAWNSWSTQGLAERSPNLAPRINLPEELQKTVSAQAFRKLTYVLNGERTLRDVAVKVEQDLLLLTRSLINYCRKGIIVFTEIADLSSGTDMVTEIRRGPLLTNSRNDVSIHQPATTDQKKQLIAYIDDNQLDSLTMGLIVGQAGYEYISIQEPMQALSTLLKHRPSLIFLDLVMPIANGYEVCAQFRRVSLFKETPIIILTSSDGVVDRVRAKMVGSTGFLPKPINTEKVVEVLRKYLPAPLHTNTATETSTDTLQTNNLAHT